MCRCLVAAPVAAPVAEPVVVLQAQGTDEARQVHSQSAYGQGTDSPAVELFVGQTCRLSARNAISRHIKPGGYPAVVRWLDLSTPSNLPRNQVRISGETINWYSAILIFASVHP